MPKGLPHLVIRVGVGGWRVRGPYAADMTGESGRPRTRSQRCRVTPSVTGVGPGSRVRAGSLAARGVNMPPGAFQEHARWRAVGCRATDPRQPILSAGAPFSRAAG